MKLKYFVLAFFCTACLSCGQNTTSSTDVADKTIITEEQEINLNDKARKLITSSADTAGLGAKDKLYNGTNPVIDWDKRIIKTATIETACNVYKTYNQQLHALVKQYGGWIAAESEASQLNRINNTMSIKVPVMQFEDMLTAVANLDGKTIQKNIVTEDVTGQVVDTKGRVELRKEMRDKYISMLKQTGKMDDMLKVQSRIDNIHEEIEMAATRLQALQHQSAYSTVNINYYQLIDVAPTNDESKGSGFISRVGAAAISGGSWVAELFIGLISIWPLVLVGCAILYYLRRQSRLSRVDNKHHAS